MARIRAILLRAAGTNCDLETQYAWECAGAIAERVHIRQLIAQPRKLLDYQVLTIPGGFSYGDDIAAGRIFAAQIRRHLSEVLQEFVERGRLVLGICNGFQVLVTAGFLPFPGPNGRRVCTIAPNDPPGFQDRWVTLRATSDRCVFLEHNREYQMPIAHAEGRVLFDSPQILAQVRQEALNALTYVESLPGAGAPPLSPANPNGSQADIAGLCDATGRILGLMPHPERFVRAEQHPCWTSRKEAGAGDGLAIFRKAVTYFA